MKKIILFVFLICVNLPVRAQKTDAAIHLLIKLDSIANSSSVSRHFAAIYFETTVSAINFFMTKSARVQQLFERLETSFANFFFKSAEAYKNGRPVAEVWKAYYEDSTASSLRYILYGINAHVNGDIWQALTREFSAAEIAELKPYYFSYHKELVKKYRAFYENAYNGHARMRTLHALSLGFDRFFGKMVMSTWRKRQIDLAELYYADPMLFEKKRERIQHKRNRLNILIRKNS